MKHFNFTFKLLFLFVAGGLLITSCDPDEPMDDLSPTISLVDEAGFISSATTITAGEAINVKVSATKGDAEMNSFVIMQDGTALSPDDVSIVNNPTVLFDADRTSFTYEISIVSHASGTATYSFEVTADDNTSSSASVDVTIDDVVIEPELVNNMNSSITLENPGTVQIVLTATQGSSPLNTVSVFEEGSLITDLTRLTWDVTAFDANPYFLPTEDKTGFTDRKLFLKSSNTVGVQNYTITVTDEAGFETTIPYTITIEPLATDFTETFTAVKMFNNSGPMAGAIDLETGTNVSSSDATADLVDLGIDGDGNWLQEMAPASGTILKSIDGSYTYDNVTSRELVIAAFDSGTELSATGTLAPGSTYVASMGTTYYILTVATVNPTTADNNDFYEFNIKKSSL